MTYTLKTILAAGLLAVMPAMVMAQASTPKPPPVPFAQTPVGQASKAVQDAKAQYDAATLQYNRARAKIAAQFATKPEFVAAKAAADKARADSETARNVVLASLSAKPDYKAARARKDAIDGQFRQATESGAEDAARLGQQQIEIGIQVKKMETDALEADTKYVDARNRYAEATKTLAGLQLLVDDAARTDQECITATQQMTTTKQAWDSARQSLATASKAEADARAAAAKAKADAAKASRGTGTGTGGRY